MLQMPRKQEDILEGTTNIRHLLHQAYLSGLTGGLLASEEVELVCQLLLKHCEPGNASGSQHITYLGYLNAIAEYNGLRPSFMSRFLTPTTFLRLKQQNSSTISVNSLLQHLIQRASKLSLRMQLSRLDSDADGYLTSRELWSFLAQTTAHLPSISSFGYHLDIHEYVDVAASKLMFLHSSRGLVRICDLLASPLLDEFLSQADTATSANTQGAFSPQSVISLKEVFRDLDKDRDGLLTAFEFAGYSQNTMSPLFISRLFEQYCTRSSTRISRNFMRFSDFCHFVFAWDNRHTPQGIKYFFPLLDFKQRGYITQVELYAFFKEIHKMWVDFGQYADLKVADVVNEVLDIIKPVDVSRITANDFVRSGMGGIMLGILADVNLFWEYENRESLAPQKEEDSAGTEVV